MIRKINSITVYSNEMAVKCMSTKTYHFFSFVLFTSKLSVVVLLLPSFPVLPGSQMLKEGGGVYILSHMINIQIHGYLVTDHVSFQVHIWLFSDRSLFTSINVSDRPFFHSM